MKPLESVLYYCSIRKNFEDPDELLQTLAKEKYQATLQFRMCKYKRKLIFESGKMLCTCTHEI